MTAQTDLHPSQPSFRMRCPKDTGSGQGRRVVLGVIRYKELVARLGLESLRTAPRHVLNHQEGAVGNENVIQGAMADDSLVETLNNAGEN